MAFTLRHTQKTSTAPKVEGFANEQHISCIINRFLFKDEESGFFVFSAQIPDSLPNPQAVVNGQPFNGKKFAVVGTSSIMSQAVLEGQEVEVWGNFEAGKQAGSVQFSAKAIQEKIPTKPRAIELFLSSGKIYGVGPRTAKKIVSTFGARTIEFLDENPAALLEVEGISLKKLEMIKSSWSEWRSVYEIVATMRLYGIGDSAGVKIFDHFKEKAMNIIKNEPYDLTEVTAIGFRTADKIAQQTGKSPLDPKRIEKCILFTMEEISESGSTAYPVKDLAQKTNELLELDDMTLINDKIQELIDKEELISKHVTVKKYLDKEHKKFEMVDQDVVAHARIHNTEVRIAKELKRVMTHPSIFTPEQEAENIESFISENKYELDDSQLDAAKIILSNKVSILTGGPGTGKTHTIKSILGYFDSIGKDCVYLSGMEDLPEEDRLDLKSVLSAPTGRAAKRMNESTGKQSGTMHRTLGFKDGQFVHNENNKLRGDVFVTDEVSMVDIWLKCSFLKAIPSNAKLIFVGDFNQLESVGPGKVLKDLITSGYIPVAYLKQIHRQAENSNIIKAAHDIINNKVPQTYDLNSSSDFAFVEKNTAEDIHSTILEITKNMLDKGADPDSIQILSPKKESEVGTKNLNNSLRSLLNPIYAKYKDTPYKFVPGDRVMQFKNNRDLDIFNGDIGKINSVEEEGTALDVVFDNRHIQIEGQDMSHLNLSYAITIHKSQGSDYPTVIIPLSKSHSFMWDANLLYTAVTRGKFKVILVGDRKTLFNSVASFRQKERITGLREEIIKIFNEPEPDLENKSKILQFH